MCSSLPRGSILPSIRIVSNRVIYYYSVCVDLSSVRSIHALEHCPCITDPKLGLNGADCGAVHYGLCSPLILPPAVDLQKLQTLTPIVAKVESYRDKIQAAIELLAVEEEPADLETLLRNFVLEDRRRQESKQLSANELESKGKKIVIKSQPQIDIINNLRNDESPTKNVFGVRIPADKDKNQSLVRSRLSKFDQDRSTSSSPSSQTSAGSSASSSAASSASSSDASLASSSGASSAPSSATCLASSSVPSVEVGSDPLQSQSEKLIFGISPKSTSLSRYKSIIELRKSESPSSETNTDKKDITKEGAKQRTIIVRNTPVSDSPKIASLSAPSPPFGSVGESATLASAPTQSVIDSKCVRTRLEPTPTPLQPTSSFSVPSNVSPNFVQMSPSPVKTLSSSTNTSSNTSSTTKSDLCQKTSSDSKQRNGKSRPLSAPESSMEQFIAQQLTDDEKALLQRNSRMSTKDDQKLVVKNGNNNKVNGNSGNSGNSGKPKPANDKPKPRIITLSRPLPKPEPKPVEPKFVNGKLVFGQIPVKPYLAKGSVAERVLLFEKCPEKTSVTKVKMSDTNKNGTKMPNKLISWMKLNDNKPNEISRRFSRSNSLTGAYPAGQIPRFYYPLGRPYSSHEVETQIRKITSVFDRFPSRMVGRKEFGGILKIVGLPQYWKEPVFRAVNKNNNNIITNGNGKKEVITCDAFVDYWKKVISSCYDDASRFMKILTGGERNYLLPDDFAPLIQDVIDTHPGLAFLKEAQEFHSRYIHTVIARIFYCANKSWSGRISLPELRKSNFLQVLSLLEHEDDINQITDYFSYEHFYVIYCKFWELDKDHDLYISKSDLNRHNDSAISSRMIDRIFSGAVTRGTIRKDDQMSYSEFVWFLLSEEDKRHPRSIEYWFRCMDLDGDGFLSMYELEYFYSEQIKRMEAVGIEALPFNDCLCQMLDLVRPQQTGRISLADLKTCRLTPIFFDTFFNLEKYLDHEQRDPFASSRDEDGLTMSDWDRYAAEEYELLVAEENAQQNNSNLLDFTGQCGSNNHFLIAANKFGLHPTSSQRDHYDYDYDYVDTDSDYSY